jgi:hypothetical protein
MANLQGLKSLDPSRAVLYLNKGPVLPEDEEEEEDDEEEEEEEEEEGWETEEEQGPKKHISACHPHL